MLVQVPEKDNILRKSKVLFSHIKLKAKGVLLPAMGRESEVLSYHTHFLVSHSESLTLQEGSKTLFLQSSQGLTLRLETGTSPSKQLPFYLLNRLGFYVKFHLAKGFSCFGKETCPSASQRLKTVIVCAS